jgi:hypothetical protein
MDDKQSLAQAINDHRIFPRLLLVVFIYLWYESTQWFMALSTPTDQQAIFIASVWGSVALFANWYMKTGTKQ